MDLSDSELVEIGLDALEAESPALPAGMHERVLAAATRDSRPAVHPDWAATARAGVTPLAAFIKTTAELAHLLDALTPDEWAQPTAVQGSSVRELVAHLVGVERYVLGQLERRAQLPAPRAEDHFPVAARASADLRDVDAAALSRAWWAEVMELIGACGEVGPEHPAAYHHLAGSTRGLMVVRTFEVWTHGDDIRRAIDHPLNDLDAARLTLMSSDLMDALPIGMALSGTTQPGRSARVILTGAGGGDYAVPLAPAELVGAPDITITAGTVELCRLASNRLPVEELDVVVEGDRSLLEPMLVGATAFAMD